MTLNATACRGLASFGVGVACFVIGSAATVAAVPGGALAAGSLAAGMLTGIGPNIVSAVGHDALNATWSSIAERLRAASRRGALPENHDLARALRRAQLLGLAHCVERCRDDVRRHPEEFDVRAMRRFLRGAEDWIADEITRADRPDFFIGAPADEPVSDAIGLLTNEGRRNDVAAGFRRLDVAAREALLGELASGTGATPPDAFVEGFNGVGAYEPGWRGAAFAFFAEQLKKDERLRTVVFLERMNVLLAGQAEADAQLAAGIEAILASAGRLDRKLDRLNDAIEDLTGSVDRLPGRELPPLVIPSAPTTARTSLGFASRLTPFVGREPEMAALARFVGAPDPFLWLSVSGPGGAGKSRLLLEFVISASPAWGGGFVDLLRPGFAWGTWRPSGDVLVVVDYATTQSEQVRAIFASLSATSGAGGRVRVVVADRCDRATMESRLFPGEDLFRFLPFAFGEPIQLAPLAAADLRRLTAAISGRTDDDTSGELPELPPESGFPLFAALAAQAMSEGRFPRNLDRQSIIRNWYDREKARYWKPAQVSRSEIRLTCLATISGGMSAETALSGVLLPCGIDAADVETDRLAAIGGERSLDRFPPLTPDILGEYFVLQTLREQNPGSSLTKAMLQFAWQHSADRTAGFMERVAEDFPDHPIVTSLIGFVPADAPEGEPLAGLGRPTLPTVWAGIVPRLPLGPLLAHHSDATLALVLTACRIEPDHPRLAELRELFGAKLFDDPLRLNNLIMEYVEDERAPDFAEARDLALRLSDIRWRTAHTLGNLLANLDRFSEAQANRIIYAASDFLAFAQRDRRVRRDMSGALLDAVTASVETGDLKRAEACWKLATDVFDWWLENPEFRAVAANDDVTPRGSSDILERIIQANAADPSAFPDDQVRLRYAAFSTDEDQTDGPFVEQYGKAAANLVMLLLRGGADGERRRVADAVLAQLARASELLEGGHDLAGRMVEALAHLAGNGVLVGDDAAVGAMQQRAEALIARFEADGVRVDPGGTYLAAQIANALARTERLDEARAVLEALERSTRLPDDVRPSETEAVGNALFNLATKLLVKEPEEALRLGTLLDGLEELPTAPCMLEAKIAWRRNRMVSAMRAGRPDQAVDLLMEIVNLADRARTRAEVELVSNAAGPLLGGGPITAAAARTVAAAMTRALAGAAASEDPSLIGAVLLHLRTVLPPVARADLEAETSILRAAREHAADSFADADAFMAELAELVAEAAGPQTAADRLQA